MKLAQMLGKQAPDSVARPTDDELDLFGITHPGKVRKENQDHFLLATIHPEVVIRSTSLSTDALPLRGSRFGTFALVADGVGGAAAGSDAARIAAESVARYVSESVRALHMFARKEPENLEVALKEAAMLAHDAVRAEAASRPEQKRMATTLTLMVAAWPWMYVMQVGDSRLYVLQEGKLRLITRDQTVAQMLVDEGSMTPSQLKSSPLHNVLASAIGADEATPEVTRVDVTTRTTVILMCSDGLTKHVKDDEIERHLKQMKSSEQVCNDLLNLALERGGTDNITILSLRSPPKTK
jgi:serine/threonine protein phosphatase PrpC